MPSETGDPVTCHGCGFLGRVPKGSAACPICKGMLIDIPLDDLNAARKKTLYEIHGEYYNGRHDVLDSGGFWVTPADQHADSAARYATREAAEYDAELAAEAIDADDYLKIHVVPVEIDEAAAQSQVLLDAPRIHPLSESDRISIFKVLDSDRPERMEAALRANHQFFLELHDLAETLCWPQELRAALDQQNTLTVDAFRVHGL